MNNPFETIDQRLYNIECLMLEMKKDLSIKKEFFDPLERFTRAQVKSKYKVSLATLHKLMRGGELDFIKVGRKTLFTREALEKCFSKKRKEPSYG